MWQDAFGWIDDHGAGVSALAAITTACIAVLTLIRASADSRKRSQPSVIAEVRPAPGSHSVIDFVVTNTGPTVAREVSVSFDPPISIPEDRKDEPLVVSYLIQRYSVPIPTIAPGQELSNSYWVGEQRGARIENSEPTPERVRVTVRYRGIGRRWLSESFVLAVDTITLNTWAESHSTSSVENRLKSVADSLKAIASVMKSADGASGPGRLLDRLGRGLVRGGRSSEPGGEGVQQRVSRLDP